MRSLCITIAGCLLSHLVLGCGDLRYDSTATTFDRPLRGDEDSIADIWFKTSYVYPIRDYLAFTWLGRALCGDEAWNVTPDGGVADGPFFVNRDIAAVSTEQAHLGPAVEPPPVGPWRVVKPKPQGSTPGFIGQDAGGRTFIVKLDHPDYPELGTSAEMIGSRLTWLLGYHVPAVYLVTIEGTGDERYDGQRATASPLVPGRIIGRWKFDGYRMRRELRTLRLVAEWLNDPDRVDNNTLAAEQDGRTVCYLIDFNSCLGSWNARPKEAWRGWRHAWDLEYQLLGLLTLGLLPRVPSEVEVPSRAVGALSADDASLQLWKQQNPNTAFDRLTRADATWMAQRMAAVSVEQLQSIVAAARFSRVEDAEYVLRSLLLRRSRILSKWGVPAGPSHVLDQSRPPDQSRAREEAVGLQSHRPHIFSEDPSPEHNGGVVLFVEIACQFEREPLPYPDVHRDGPDQTSVVRCKRT